MRTRRFYEVRGGRSSFEIRYYLSSQQPRERPPEAWIDLIGEDRTRSRKPNLVANLALLRRTLLRLLHDH
jgi:hypothetical protein